MPQRDLCDQTLEANSMLRTRARLAQVVIDQDNPGSLPSQRHRPVHQRVLQPRGLLVAHHLLPRGLPDVHHRQAFTVPSRNLAPRMLPRHHRDHGSPPLPGSGATAGTAFWLWAASLRRAITASQYTATRRRASGTAAHTSHSSKPALWGRRPLPRPTRRRTSRPRGHLPQPFHRGDHAEQALPPHQRLLPRSLLPTHRRSLHNGSRRSTTSATPPSPRTPPRPEPAPLPTSWPACATWSSGCSVGRGRSTSPPRYAATPATRADPSPPSGSASDEPDITTERRSPAQVGEFPQQRSCQER